MLKPLCWSTVKPGIIFYVDKSKTVEELLPNIPWFMITPGSAAGNIGSCIKNLTTYINHQIRAIHMPTYGLRAATICDNSIFHETIRDRRTQGG